MQFNMQFGQVWDEADPAHAPIRLEETLAEIRRQEPDILFLQEVEHAANPDAQRLRPNYHRLVEGLPGYHSVCHLPEPDPRELPFGIGLALFSRTPLLADRRHVLPSPPIVFEFQGRRMTPTDRIAIEARTLVGGRELALFNAHLLAFFMLGSSSSEHPEQRACVAGMLSRETGPALLGGDFNVSKHASLVRQFEELGCRSVQSTVPTWRSRAYVLDHLFHNSRLSCRSVRVVPTPASDHHVLVAEMEFD